MRIIFIYLCNKLHILLHLFQNELDMTIEDIKSILDDKGMTFTDLAEKMGKERSVVYKTIQNGNPTLSFLFKLSDALGKSIDDIVKFPECKSEHTEETRKEHNQINGFVEVNGTIYRIRTQKDLDSLYTYLDE